MNFEAFSAGRTAELCGFRTVAMLDYLERSGVFVRAEKSKRRGRRRKYTFRDLVVLRAIRMLLDSGASVASLKRALTEFQQWKWKAEVTVLEDKMGGLRYLVASGNKIYFAHNANALVELSNQGQLAFAFILDLDRVHQELCAQMGLPRHAELQLTA